MVIDKEAPTATLNYSPTGLTNSGVVVTLTTNEVVFKPVGWDGSATGTIFTKKYTTDTTETV
ncbi:MAG: hypothetical protein LBH46_01590, partial [Rickettsiales bacterium]|nr:hypothetical protein [Rickettsiales bacterium]